MNENVDETVKIYDLKPRYKTETRKIEIIVEPDKKPESKKEPTWLWILIGFFSGLTFFLINYIIYNGGQTIDNSTSYSKRAKNHFARHSARKRNIPTSCED